MKRFLLLVCLAFVLLGSASANIDEDNTSAAQTACQALLSACQLQCGSHEGINTGAANCIIENDGSVDLNCVCNDGYQPPSSSAVRPQAVFTALVATGGAVAALALA
ncbi:hypothetical protein Ndes2437B_g05511 [Nannochloris sp. 'desiccata']|nr:hypothetical protein KSW81_007514 [Chlorella desiccata (nom. nud.)]